MNNNTNRTVRALLTISGSLVLVHGVTAYASSADEPPPANTSGADSDKLIRDIIVTANRRSEALQSVPVAITAFTGDSLRREGITSNQDLAGKVPSLIVGQASGQRDTQTFTIRGQGSTYGGGPGVAVYLAEVPLPQREDTVGQIGTGTMFFDLTNVQVLKGPQGTLFGRNTTGGAVLVEPVKPKGIFDGYVQVQTGNYNDREFEAMLNVPLVTDKLALRVAGRFAQRDGYTIDVKTLRDLDNRNYWTGRASLLWTPNSAIENNIVVSALQVNQSGTGSVFAGFNSAINPTSPTAAYQGSAARTYGLPLLTAVLAAQQSRGPRAVDLNVTPLDEQRLFMASDSLTVDLTANLKLRNIASYARYRARAEFDQDGSPLNISDTGPESANSTDARQWTEEFQLQGKALADAFKYAVGYYHEDANTLGPQVRAGSNNGAYTNITQAEHRWTNGVYGQGTLDFAALTRALASVELTGGYRYTWDHKEAQSSFKTATICVLPTVATAWPACLVQRTLDSKAPSWTLGLDYKVRHGALLYAKVSHGYKSGGFNYNGTNPQVLLFLPEYLTTYEAGVKSDFRLARMPVRLNGAYYYSKYTDIQKVGSSIVNLPGGGFSAGSATVNAGRAHIQGLELESTISPVKNLFISGSYAYTAAKYDDFKFSYLSGSTLLIDDKTAVPFSFTPKNQYSVSGSYKIEMHGNQSITPSFTFSHVDRYYTQITDPAQEPFGYLPASNLLNLRVSWDNLANLPMDLAFFMTNVTNKTFPIQVQANYGKNGASYGAGFARYIYSEPRMFGAQLRYRFGAGAQ